MRRIFLAPVAGDCARLSPGRHVHVMLPGLQKLGPQHTAAAVRLAVRLGLHSSHTAGLAKGYVQGNVYIMPEEHATHFRDFCLANPAPCPLIGQSQPGDPSLPTLGRDIDIRCDVPKYSVFRDGIKVEERGDVRDLWTDKMVAFVLGCSFSCEGPLAEAGLRLPYVLRGRNVAMYRTNTPLQTVGPFAGKMVVSMRPFVPREVPAAVIVTARYPAAHGAPVHIGLPKMLGVQDLERPDYGDAPDMDTDSEVPVFWACGVTPQTVIEHARLPLVMTHSPGCMLLTDVLVQDSKDVFAPLTLRPRLGTGSLEQAVLQDSLRGMAELAKATLPADFLTHAAQLLLRQAQQHPGQVVLITTGFYIQRASASETDGPPGAVALARALQLLGIPVALLTDKWSLQVVRSCAGSTVEVLEWPMEADPKKFAAELAQTRRPAAVVAIERCGLTADGRCLNFRGQEFSDYNAHMDYLFHLFPNASVGVGDGGNEIGMGLLARAAPSLLPPNPCVTAVTSKVVASSSNWGAFGICAALAAITNKRALLPSVGQSEAWVEACVSAGAVDGITGLSEHSVDGRPPATDKLALVELHRLLDEALIVET
eukprot:gb/GEZN01001090.1/.p1 GENE.gb/GEZN01001090.1/~~gb/GEZN01001090.1/.p1  ORF type:complete len:595 (-),score=91.20 gb/GEZN01001090.1/:850-2634(-)